MKQLVVQVDLDTLEKTNYEAIPFYSLYTDFLLCL